MVSITPELTRALESKIDSYTSKANGVPGLVYKVVNKDGSTIFEHASGHRGLGSEEPMTLDTVFSIASCTKLITTIATMQLVEQGKLELDSEEQVETILPELRDVKVLVEGAKGKLELVDKKRKITLRMLLTHTAGFGYSFANAKLKRWFEPIGILEDGNEEQDIFGQPLVNQPGERFQYGVNIDWAGRMVERVSGLSLDEYCQKYIVKPLGLSETTFFPTQAMKNRLAYLHQRDPDGTLQLRENGHLIHRPLKVRTAEEIKATVNSGGAGIFSSPAEYCEVLATLLNGGTHSRTGTRLLKSATVDEMMKNQIPHLPDFARALDPSCKPQFVNSAPEMYPQPGNPGQGWGLSFFKLLEPGPTGRPAGTIWWSGVFNLVWWADVENGIAGMIASQILPFGDLEVFTCQAEIEAAIYAEVLKGRST